MILQLILATLASALLNIAFLYRQPLAAIVAGFIFAFVLWRFK